MSVEDYLTALTAQLTEGVGRLPPDFRARHADYLRSRQNADGGFSGREGGSDLYYTGFALRGLTVLGTLTPEVCQQASPFLRGCLARQASLIDLFSLLYSCLLVQAATGADVLADCPPNWPDLVASALEALRSPDGGYAKSPGATSGSTYHTFLVGLCWQLLGRPMPRAADVVRFIHSRRRDDGGFVELAPMRRSGTNPTAGAVGTLQLADPSALTPEVRAGVCDFVARMPSWEGGLRAHDRIPLADLLSTFTGAWTLAQLSALDRLDADAVRRYARSLEQPDGGFRGGTWDQGADVEYTFYGLGVLGLFA